MYNPRALHISRGLASPQETKSLAPHLTERSVSWPTCEDSLTQKINKNKKPP